MNGPAERDGLIRRTAERVQAEFQDDASGHDWWHIARVWRTARLLCEREGGDSFTVELAALLHDLDDWKFAAAADGEPRRARAWMESCGIDPAAIGAVCAIIRQVSFKGAGVEDARGSLEARIVRDADRLDAIGAIGIGRAFAYGGSRGRPLYDPDAPPQRHASFEAYRGSRSATLNHFHEKLLLLRDRMQTETARRLAQGRHEVMLRFLEQFMAEWEGADLEAARREG